MWFMGKKQKKKNSIEKEELVFLCIFYGEVVGKSFVDMGLKLRREERRNGAFYV